MINITLEAGAEVNVKGKDYITALHVASQNGHAEVVKILLGAGADLNAQITRTIKATRMGIYINSSGSLSRSISAYQCGRDGRPFG